MKRTTCRESNKDNPRFKMMEGAGVTVDEFKHLYGAKATDALMKFSAAIKKRPEDVINGPDAMMSRFENWAKKNLKVDIYDNFSDDYMPDADRTDEFNESFDDDGEGEVKTYTVRVYETYSKDYEVEAADPDEAHEKAEELAYGMQISYMNIYQDNF